MVKPTEKRIYLLRHAEAEHNVSENYSIKDARLTPRGRQQAAKLNEHTKHTVQQSAHLLVSSGLRRTLSTTVLAFPALRKRLEAAGKPVVVLPQLQEVNDLPCDTGSDDEDAWLVPVGEVVKEGEAEPTSSEQAGSSS
ncbi:hypothetical protein BN946_scf184370.g3 [Trametes cinnabarina]|uniref:Uncharacterized protein n=1 Tax=Pycnoporus cinnabarinus TaxID=5643 RepID=A0A060S780_PYCCI|nr:hypothetical protein BN946_scf184370.g3 [Trametes cinnabarina]